MTTAANTATKPGTLPTRALGRSGLRVSTLCLGTMTFGEADANSFMHGVGCDEATSFGIMDRALDAGVNFFDTADIYGQDGLTERVLGRWFARSGRRDEVVLASKFRFRTDKGPNGTGASRHHIRRCVEDSLRRLGTDRLDLYQIHMQDLDTPEDETLRALDDLVRQGKVLYLGASNYTAWRLMQSLWTSETQRLERFVALQAQYSLMVRDIERELVPVCREYGLGVLPWSPLASGFLSGKYHKGEARPEGSRLAAWQDRFGSHDHPRGWAVVAALRQVAEAHGVAPAAIALAWLLHKPVVTSVIFGARTVEQLDDNLVAASIVLAPEELRALDAASAVDWGYPYDFCARVQGRW